MWVDYDENDVYDEQQYYNIDNWSVRINDISKYFEIKEDAVFYIVEELDLMYDIFNNTTKYTGTDELFDLFMKLDCDDFYDTLKDICKYHNIKDSIKLINLDDDQPEFREL